MKESTYKKPIFLRILRGILLVAMFFSVVLGGTVTSFTSDSSWSIANITWFTPGYVQAEMIVTEGDEISPVSTSQVPYDIVVEDDPLEASNLEVEEVSPSLAAATPEVIVNEDAVIRGGYYVKVNRQANTVTVYTQDESGEYTVPVRAMVCSVGLDGATPTGVFSTSDKYLWRELVGHVYGQYAYRIYQGILFHSVPYLTMNEGTLEEGEFNLLGQDASHGCVRLCVRDAKWIYDNVPVGSTVEIYDSADPGPLGKPSSGYVALDDARAGWDPTDPAADNPWAIDPRTDTTAPVIDISEIPSEVTFSDLEIIETDNGQYIRDALKHVYLNDAVIHITDEGGILASTSIEITGLYEGGEGEWLCEYNVYAEDEGHNITEISGEIEIIGNPRE